MPQTKDGRGGVVHATLTGWDFRVDPPLTPLRAIRKKCMECTCNAPTDIAKCTVTDCTLWPYRLGKRPRRKAVDDTEE